MEKENRAFLEMLKPAKERLRGRPVGDIAANTQIEFRREQQEFHLSGLGHEITISYPSYDVEPSWNEWYVLMLLHYMDMADGTPLSSELITFGELKEGMVRGGGFDRKCENVIRTAIGKKEPEKVRKACAELGADFGGTDEAAFPIALPLMSFAVFLRQSVKICFECGSKSALALISHLLSDFCDAKVCLKQKPGSLFHAVFLDMGGNGSSIDRLKYLF